MIQRRRLILTALAMVATGPAGAEAWFADRGLAIRGTDPVAYFTDGAARRGDPAIRLAHGGVDWLFASEANRTAFAADPDRFAPQYGGWCAWAMAEGYLAPIDPDQWRIVEGRLYLNASARVQRRWLGDSPGFIARADANWPRLRPE
jgi:hypothetical protein